MGKLRFRGHRDIKYLADSKMHFFKKKKLKAFLKKNNKREISLPAMKIC